jgi:hypothetical protein
VSIVAVLIATCSLALAWSADRRARRAEARGLRADLVVEQTGSSSEMRGRRFDLEVRNVGSGVARGVRVWLENEAGRVVSTVAGDAALTLAPDEDPVALGVTVSEDTLAPPPVVFGVLISWSDGEGHHERHDTGVTAST